MKQILIIFSLLFLFSSRNYSQKNLTLDESIDIALKQSYTYKNAETQLQNTIRGLESTKLRMLSRVDFSLSPSYNRSISSQFDPSTSVINFFRTEQTNWGANLSISQPILFTNGNLSLSSSFSGYNQLDKENQTIKNNYWNLSLSLQQPLFAINTQKINLERAEMNLEKTITSFTRTQMDIVYNVTQGFYDLYKSLKQLEINEMDVKQREESFNTSVKKFKAGLIPEVNMLQLDVELANAKNEMIQKRRQFDQQQNQFKVLIGLPLEEEISVSISDENQYNLISIDTNKVLELTLENNIELKNWKYDRKIQENSIDQIKQQNRIRADLIASYGLNKNNDGFENLFVDPANTRGVSLKVSIPVWDWGANNLNIEAAESELSNMDLSHDYKIIQIKQEVLDLLNKIELIKFRIEIAKKGLQIALKSYDISLERYKSGQIKSDEMVQEQGRLTNSKQNELNAIMEYKLALADLKRKTFYDFELDKPIKIIKKGE